MPLYRPQTLEIRISPPITYSTSRFSDSSSPLINSMRTNRLDLASLTLNSSSISINLKIKIHNIIPENPNVTHFFLHLAMNYCLYKLFVHFGNKLQFINLFTYFSNKFLFMQTYYSFQQWTSIYGNFYQCFGFHDLKLCYTIKLCTHQLFQ